MTDRKIRKRSAYDQITRHFVNRLKDAGVEVGSTRDLLQIGLAALTDMAETSPVEFVEYLNSFKILSNSSKTESHICKSGEVWMVVQREAEESPLSVETFEVAPLPSVDISSTMKRNEPIKAPDVEVEEW